MVATNDDLLKELKSIKKLLKGMYKDAATAKIELDKADE